MLRDPMREAALYRSGAKPRPAPQNKQVRVPASRRRAPATSSGDVARDDVAKRIVAAKAAAQALADGFWISY
jgi:hypothetical protein